MCCCTCHIQPLGGDRDHTQLHQARPKLPSLLSCRFLNPLGMFTAMAVVSAVFIGSVWAGENRAAINNFKRHNPTAFVFVVMLASYILISMLGSVMVFMSAITLPLACKYRVISLTYQNLLETNVTFKWVWNILSHNRVCIWNVSKTCFPDSPSNIALLWLGLWVCYCQTFKTLTDTFSFVFQWYLHMLPFASATWRINWRTR